MMVVTSLKAASSVVDSARFLFIMEVMTLILHCVVAQRTPRISSVEQLAFVLASQRWLLPFSIVMPVCVLSMAITHVDNDCTFQFA